MSLGASLEPRVVVPTTFFKYSVHRVVMPTTLGASLASRVVVPTTFFEYSVHRVAFFIESPAPLRCAPMRGEDGLLWLIGVRALGDAVRIHRAAVGWCTGGTPLSFCPMPVMGARVKNSTRPGERDGHCTRRPDRSSTRETDSPNRSPRRTRCPCH